MFEVRRRKNQVHIEPPVADLSTSLLSGYERLPDSDEYEERPASSGRVHPHVQGASASTEVVPQSVNRINWELLWTTLLQRCTHRVQSLVASISTCLAPFFARFRPYKLSFIQEQRLADLRARLAVPYNGEQEAHRAALRRLWELAYPDIPFGGYKHPQWKEMGWQNEDPSSDFRGGGYITLENLLYFIEHDRAAFLRLMGKQDGVRSEWEYPFAAAGVNLTFMLTDLLELRSAAKAPVPKTPVGRGFLELLQGSDTAFEEVWCAAYQVLDREWLRMGASYMDFPHVLREVRERVGSALAMQFPSVKDVRYFLLK